jgi:nitrogen regulatory protein PII
MNPYDTVKIAGIGRTGARVIRHMKQAEWKCDLLAKIDRVIFLEDDTKSEVVDRNGTFPIRHPAQPGD